MAKGTNIGFLNFGIDGDDTAFKKKLAALKNDAISIESIFKNIKINTGSSGNISTDITKAQLASDKLLISSIRVGEARERAAALSLISEQRLNNELGRGMQIQRQSELATSRISAIQDNATNRRLLNERRIQSEQERTIAMQLLNSSRISSIESERIRRDALNEQRRQSEILRTEILRQRLTNQSTASQNQLNRSIELTNKTMFNQKALLQQMSNALGIYFSIYQVGAFVKELAMVSGEFEKQRASLAAILQDSDAANKLFGQIKDLAVISPFNFKELTGYAKQLSAFSIPTNEIYDTMKRLADVSAGLGVDMNRIILAYGQVRSASVLRGQELRQFTEAGIPLVDELAKKFGELENRVVSAGDVFDKISNREVPFSMIKEIFTDLTSEGGKFFEMQEIQSATLAGKISNLRDAYDIMLDSIGSANSGLLKGSVDMLVKMMDNWERYWDILKGIIYSYGVYKAVVIATAIANNGLAASIKACAAAQAIFNTLTSANKYALIAAGITLLISAFTAYNSAQDRANEELISSITVIRLQSESVNELIGKLKELTTSTKDDAKIQAERAEIINQIAQKEPELAEAIKKHADNLSALSDEQERYNKLVDARKFAQYAIADTGGFLDDNLVDDIKDLTDAQNQADLSAVKLENTYTRMREVLDQINSDGGLKVGNQLKQINEGVNKSIQDIIKSDKSRADQVLEVSRVLKIYNAQVGRFSYAGTLDLYDKIFNKGKDYVDDYSKSLKSVSEASDEANKELDRVAAALDANFRNKGIGTAIIDNLKAQFKELGGISYNDFIKLDPVDQKSKFVNEDLKKLFDNIQSNENIVRSFVKDLADLGKYGQERILTQWDIEINGQRSTESPLTGWRKQLQDILGNTITIQTDTNLPDVIKEMREKAKAFKEEIEDQKPLLIKLGFDFDKNAFPFPANDIAMAVANNYIANQKNLDNINKAAKELNVTLDNKKKKSEKDKFTDDLKDQVELIKQAKAEYEKLLKVMSSDEAAKKLKSIEPYKNIDINNLSDSGYVDYLNSQLKKIEKRNTDTAKNVRIAWNKELAQVQVEKITDDAKKALDKLEKTLSQDKERFNLYKQIFGITGDKAQAAQMAFGDPNKIVGEYIDLLKSSFKAQTNISFSDFINLDDDSKNKLLLQENVKKLAEDIQSTEWTNKADFSKQMAELVVQYRTVDEQITAIREKGEATRLEILKNTDNASQDLVEARLRANREAISKGIADLTNGALQATESYQRLFGEIGNISEKELGYLIKKWKDIISQARKNTDGSLTVTVDGKNFTTTEKEIASFSKRIIKSETELRNRNPFKALKASLDELSNNRSKIKEIENEIKGLEDSMSMASNSKANGSNNPINDLILSTSGAKITDLNSKLADLGEQGATSFMKVGSAIGSIGQSASEIGQSLSGMFDALGNESMADTVGFIGELADSASQIGEGLASKDPIKVIKGIASGITSIANFHDKKLDRSIKRSQLEVKKLGNAYNEIQRTIARQLSAISEAQSKEMIENQEKQIDELRKQQQAERDKKKTDNSVVLDLEDQINAAEDKLKYFYEDLANEQFGINFKEWAGTLADSLVEAFSSGENAAKAFDRSVADIMKSVIKNMISLQVIQPAMDKLRDKLFGKNGLLANGTTNLSNSDGAEIIKELMSFKDKVGDAKSIWDALNEAAKQAGISLEDTAKQDTMTKGIQALSEDTGNIITSYINSMRADLAAQLAEIRKISLFSENCTTTFALMLAELTKIQVNTYNTANNTREIADTVKDTNAILKSVTVKNGAIGINMY